MPLSSISILYQNKLERQYCIHFPENKIMHKMFQTYISEELPATERTSHKTHTVCDELRRNSQISHRNPLSRSKPKNEERRSQMLTRSEVSQFNGVIPPTANLAAISVNVNHHQDYRLAVSEISDFANTEAQRKFRLHEKMLQGKLEEVMQRVSRNEKQIEKLTKLCSKQSHTMKILSDFKEIKDVYTVIRDHKIMQNEFNLKMNEEINNAKQIIGVLRQQVERACKNCQSHSNRLQYSIKQVEKTLKNELQRKTMPKLYPNCQPESQEKPIKQLEAQVLELRLKVTQIEHKQCLQNALTLGSCQVKHSSLSSIRSTQSIPVIVEQNMQSKVGSLHSISRFVYYVDRNGYLLDENKYYLLNENNELIKMEEQHLEKLKSICQVIEQHK